MTTVFPPQLAVPRRVPLLRGLGRPPPGPGQAAPLESRGHHQAQQEEEDKGQDRGGIAFGGRGGGGEEERDAHIAGRTTVLQVGL